MAYVECSRCRQIAFSPPRWSSIDYCARCGTTLPQGRRVVTPIPSRPRFQRLPPGSPGPQNGSAA